MWPSFIKRVGKKIGNGRTTNMWFDNWSDLNCPIVAAIPELESHINKRDTVKDYVTSTGNWNVQKLREWLPTPLTDRIIRAHPPCEGRGEDVFIWKPSSDGCFNIKSAYISLSAGNQHQGDDKWKKLWKWNGPEKIKTFLWLLAHDRIHTMSLRAKRNMADSDRCPFTCDTEETAMHVIRDCKDIKELWKSVVAPNLWPLFFNLQGVQWIKWNLREEVGRGSTGKLPWAFLFGYTCWEIWCSRCRKIFESVDELSSRNVKDIFYKACTDKDLLEAYPEFTYHNMAAQTNRNNDMYQFSCFL